jgi:hypothetical protein
MQLGSGDAEEVLARVHLILHHPRPSSAALLTLYHGNPRGLSKSLGAAVTVLSSKQSLHGRNLLLQLLRLEAQDQGASRFRVWGGTAPDNWGRLCPHMSEAKGASKLPWASFKGTPMPLRRALSL